MSEIVYPNRAVDRSYPGFSNMLGFFMSQNPGEFGAMFGHHAEFELPFPAFVDAMRTGLVKEDALALEFRYAKVADFLGARNVVVTYGRFGDPWVRIRGDKFPNIYVDDTMAFLDDGHMARRGYVFSDRIVFYAGYGYQEGRLLEGSGVKLETSGFYLEIADRPDIARQIPKFPDLMRAVEGYSLLTREEDPVTTDIRKATQWPGYVLEAPSRLPSPAQKQILDRYQMYMFEAEVDCAAPTLNEIIDQTRLLVPVVQQAYQATWDRFIAA